MLPGPGAVTRSRGPARRPPEPRPWGSRSGDVTWKVVQWAHGGALLCGPFVCGWTAVVRPSFPGVECASRRPGRGGAGRRGPRDRRVAAEHVTLADVLAGQVTISRVKRRARGLSDVLANRPRHDMRDTVPPCGTTSRGGAGTGRRNRPRRPVRRPHRAQRPQRPTAPGGDSGGPSRPAPAPSTTPRVTPGGRTRTPSQQPSGRGGPVRADRHHDLHALRLQNRP